MKIMHLKKIAVICVLVLTPQIGVAKVSQEEAARLKSELTPLGGERAGNADGTIPAWDGGYTSVPEGYQSGERRPDPFAKEKPLFSITAANMEQYADKLSEGQKEMLRKHPTYRFDVYPTHRTAAAPSWVYDNTFRNAVSATTSEGGLSMQGAYGGIPFPIPQSAHEVVWNHLLYWHGESIFAPVQVFMVTEQGKPVLTAEADGELAYPYYFRDVPKEKWDGDYFVFRQAQTAPPFKAGETILVRDPVDQYGKGRQAWQYLTGQRRVRRAPSIAYDTPDFVSSGQNYFDEVFVFNGAMDRYNWKLVGKKEMYIPYNNNRFLLSKAEDVIGTGTNHLNPDYLRWELHRVWVVEATLAEGKRHVVAKRRLYIDEDTWSAVLYDGWDGKGQLWRHTLAVPFVAFELPAVVSQIFAIHNLQTGARTLSELMNDMPLQWQAVPRRPDTFFTPQALSASGVR